MRRIVQFCVRYPWLVIAIAIITTGIFGYFAKSIEIDNDIMNMLPQEEPAVKAMDYIEDWFGGTGSVMVGLEADNIFTAEVVKQIDELTKKLKELKDVYRVMSLTNVTQIIGTEEGIEITPLIGIEEELEGEIPQTEDELKAFRQRVMEEESYVGSLISPDEEATLIMATLEPGTDPATIAEQVKETVSTVNGPAKIYLSGLHIMEYEAFISIGKDLSRLALFSVIALVLILYLSFRSLRGVLLPLLNVVISTIWAIGLMSILGYKITIVGIALPVLLIACGSAYAIHALSRYIEELENNQPGRSKKEALVDAISYVGVPIFLAAITTMFGFGSLVTSSIIPIRSFGLFTAWGIFVAFVYSVTLVPAILSLLGIPRHIETGKSKEGWLNRALGAISTLPVRRRWWVVGAAALLTVISIAYLPSLRWETETGSFSEESPIEKASKFIEDRFGGSASVDIVVEGDIKDPQVLKAIDATSKDFEDNPYLRYPRSVAGIIKDMNVAMNENDPAYDIVPDNRQLIAQYLLLFTMSDEEGSLGGMLTFSEDKALISARSDTDLGTSELRELVNDIRSSLDKNFEELDVNLILTGMPSILLMMGDLLRTSQLYSLLASIIAVGLVLMLIFRSPSAGLLSMVPIGLTILWNFGLMSARGIPLDIVTTMLASIALGIGVDYTVHIISRYREELQRDSYPDIEQAVTTKIRTTGKAIIYNATAVLGGFGVLMLSEFPQIDIFGELTALMTIVSVIGALLVLPALILVIGFTFKRSKVKQ